MRSPRPGGCWAGRCGATSSSPSAGLLFAFLGVELTAVFGDTGLLDDGGTLALAAAVVGTLVVSRAVVMTTASALAGRRARRRDSGTPAGWREATVASWAGMRGVVTVATALALPATVDGGADFPAREEVVVVALLVVVVTLVLQGLTLAPVIRALGVGGDGDVAADVRRLHRQVAEAALDAVQRADEVSPEVRDAVVRQYRSRLEYRRDVEGLVDGDVGGDEAGGRLRDLLARASEVEREAVMRARRNGEVSPAAADDVLFDIEARALRYGS